MGYSACFIIDVNMFWIFILFFFLSMLSQAVVFNKIFNLPYKQLVFICLVVFFLPAISPADQI